MSVLQDNTPQNTTDPQHNKYLVISIFILLFCFILPRAPFFVHYAVPGYNKDYITYYQVVSQMESGNWPRFDHRSPGFPLFLKLMYSYSENPMPVIVVQNILLLSACIVLILSVYATYRHLTIFAAIAISGYTSTSASIFHNTGLFSDNLYIILLIFFYALLILAVKKEKWLFFSAASFCMAIAILTRPAGLFLILIFLIVLLFLIRNKYPLQAILNFAAPLLVLMLLMATYNFFTIHKFTLTPAGEKSLMCATATFWEQDATYPPELNHAIKKVQDRLTENERKIVFTSWNRFKLYQVFYKHFQPHTILEPMREISDSYIEVRHFLRKVSLDAIRKHPDLYMKFVTTMVRIHFIYNIQIDLKLYKKYYPERYAHLLETNYSRIEAIKSDFIVTSQNGKLSVAVRPTMLGKMHNLYNGIIHLIFRNSYWTYLLIIAFVVSAFFLLRSSFRSREAFIIFIMTISVIASGLLVCLVQRSWVRYSFSVEFLHYLSAALLPLLFNGQRNQFTGLRVRNFLTRWRHGYPAAGKKS
jgi:hypothetical protein